MHLALRISPLPIAAIIGGSIEHLPSTGLRADNFLQMMRDEPTRSAAIIPTAERRSPAILDNFWFYAAAVLRPSANDGATSAIKRAISSLT